MIVGIFAVVCVACLLLVACDGGNSISLIYANANAYTVANDVTLQERFYDLDVDWFNGSVILKEGQAGEPLRFFEVADGAEQTRDTTMRYLLDNGTLRIKYAKSGRTALGRLKKHLYIYLPAGFVLNDVEISGTDCYIKLDDVEANVVECESKSGDIDVKCRAREVEAESLSGNVRIESEALNVDVETLSGYVTVICKSTPRELDIKTTSGNVLLRLSGDTGFRFEYDTISGLLVNAFNENTVRYGKYYVYTPNADAPASICEYEIETVSATLTIEKII